MVLLVNTFLLPLYWILVAATSLNATKVCDKTCRISRAHRMLMADCYHQELREFPCLRSDIEVIDVSFNRLRELHADDLRQFSSLRILYLMENMIMRIDERAFVGQNDLEVLDLTLNSFSTLPPTIFALPSLRRLILGHNENANIAEIIERVERIGSPLEYLDLSYNRIERLPVLRSLPTLLAYNISGNENLEMSTGSFAGLCNIKELINDNVTYRFSEPCECWLLKNWLKTRDVLFKPFECSELIQEDECLEREIPVGDRAEYDSCKQTHSEMLQKMKLMNIVLPIVAAIIILFLVVILLLVLRRRKRAPPADSWIEKDDDTKISLNNKHTF